VDPELNLILNPDPDILCFEVLDVLESHGKF
jgi:hypothetical protein